MNIFDTTAVIGLVSELTYTVTSIESVEPKRRLLLQGQIEAELENPGQLLALLESFESPVVLVENFRTSCQIIEKIAGENELDRWQRLKSRFRLIWPEEIQMNTDRVITANKKLRKKYFGLKFIYHQPRSLLGV